MNTDPKLVYRDTAANNASPLRLVVLLYEQLIEDLRRAATAIAHGDAEKRTIELGHALEVLGQLQGRLDLEQGGEVAQNLEKFYNLLRSNLLQAQVTDSAQILRQQIAHLLAIREAWLEVERAAPSSAQQPSAASASATTPEQPESQSPAISDWTA
jgi:flagellar protein FliS